MKSRSYRQVSLARSGVQLQLQKGRYRETTMSNESLTLLEPARARRQHRVHQKMRALKQHNPFENVSRVRKVPIRWHKSARAQIGQLKSKKKTTRRKEHPATTLPPALRHFLAADRSEPHRQKCQARPKAHPVAHKNAANASPAHILGYFHSQKVQHRLFRTKAEVA
jgi:hypothetical protein